MVCALYDNFIKLFFFFIKSNIIYCTYLFYLMIYFYEVYNRLKAFLNRSEKGSQTSLK